MGIEVKQPGNDRKITDREGRRMVIKGREKGMTSGRNKNRNKSKKRLNVKCDPVRVWDELQHPPGNVGVHFRPTPPPKFTFFLTEAQHRHKQAVRKGVFRVTLILLFILYIRRLSYEYIRI
jgi:hypothetical protein